MTEKVGLQAPLNQIATFLRKRDYQVVKELGQGACGKTVLLHDDQIDEQFVCKKYTPYSESHRAELFQSFIREIKLLHRIHHKNVVRVFSYYLYPSTFSGYILMEYVCGQEIDDYIRKSPERINDCFVQAVEGFAYLESCGILHRDIRMQNLMVNAEGVVKIIDLGFGKHVAVDADFKKSITLNWHCTVPAEFDHSIYDFCSEVYFLGKLFEKLIADNRIQDFKYSALLARMCAFRSEDRPASFSSVETEIRSDCFPEIQFSEDEILCYREFATAVSSFIAKIEKNAKYVTDTERVLLKLSDILRSVSMEETVPDGNTVVLCLIDGGYYFRKKSAIEVTTLRKFIEFFGRSSEARRRTILANLHSKLDALDRYAPDPFKFKDEDIPF